VTVLRGVSTDSPRIDVEAMPRLRAMPEYAALLDGLSSAGFTAIDCPPLEYLRLQAGYAGSQQDFESNDLRPILDRTYPLEQHQAAFMRLTSSARFGKVAIEL
jgi:hypothetical protein